MNNIKNLLKTNKFLYNIYFYSFSYFFRFISFLIKKDERTVLFVSYGGTRYDDSPRVFYEYLRLQQKYKDWNFVWAFENPEKFPSIIKKVKINSLKYFLLSFKSKYWITNSSVQRGLMYKNKNQVYVNFQHGTAGIKVLGRKLKQNKVNYKFKKSEDFDYIFCQGKKEIEWLSRDFELPKSKFYLSGLPRTIKLSKYTNEIVEKIKEKYSLPKEKKIILYAPTFREYNLDSNRNIYYKNPFNIDIMNRCLSEDYILVMTSHYAVQKKMENNDSNFLRVIMDPDDFNELVIIADIVVTDYSSVTFDAFAAKKPVICFAYDYEEYIESRGGTYLDMNKLFYDGIIKEQKELIKLIKNFDFQEEIYFSEKQAEKYIYINDSVLSDCEKIIFKN